VIINDPETLAEVSAAFHAYEAALGANDRPRLDETIWDSEHALAYQLGKNLYGHDAIVRFRGEGSQGAPTRVLINTVITTFGQDLATANAEFIRMGDPHMGRQSQTWVRTTEGWRIVAAHVSLIATGHDLAASAARGRGRRR
jgi:Protein of unknown function (DUF3225)